MDCIGNISIRIGADFPFDRQKSVESALLQRNKVGMPLHLAFSELHFPEQFAGFRNKPAESAFRKGIVDARRIAVAQMDPVLRMRVNNIWFYFFNYLL